MSDTKPQINVQKIYLLDASVEVPKAPEIYTRAWKPEVDVQLGTSHRKLGDQVHQVQVKVTVTAKLEKDVAFLIECEYAGIFDIRGIPEEDRLKSILGGYCPTIIFPYLREGVSDLAQRAGFPQFLLQPVDFEVLYRQHMEQASQSTESVQKH